MPMSTNQTETKYFTHVPFTADGPQEGFEILALFVSSL